MIGQRLATLLLLPGLGLVGCGLIGGWVPAAPPGAERLEPSRAAVRVVLLWGDPVDLDLYVTDPSLETVYFGNTPAGSGGKLAGDVDCEKVRRTAGGGGGEKALSETVLWTRGPAGRYRVGVDFIDPCGSGSREARFRVVADVAGRRLERVGRLARERFEPVVLEFDLPAGAGGESSGSSPEPEEAK